MNHEIYKVADIYDRAYSLQAGRGDIMGTRIIPGYNDGTKAQLVQWVTKDVPSTHPVRLLDIGTGDGDLGGYLADAPSVQWTGFDISSAGLRVAQNKFDRLQPAAGDMSCLPFAADSFDAVLCADSLEHSPDPLRTLSEIYRVLKPEGSLSVSLPEPYMFRNLLANCLAHREHKTLWNIVKTAHARARNLGRMDFQPVEANFTIDEWTGIMEGHGFLVHEVRYWPGDLSSNLLPLAVLVNASKKSDISTGE